MGRQCWMARCAAARWWTPTAEKLFTTEYTEDAEGNKTYEAETESTNNSLIYRFAVSSVYSVSSVVKDFYFFDRSRKVVIRFLASALAINFSILSISIL